jgi:K+/H+ antiporter YhaU regulatory subunit KhtT
MQKLNVRHEHLPRIGERFVLDTESGASLTVISHRSGRQDVTITDSRDREAAATASLTASEASAMAMLLSGTHIQLIATDPTRPSERH